MNILGLDPGLLRLGIAGIETHGDEIKLITYGFISHTRNSNSSFNEHLNLGIRQIVDQFPRILNEIHPVLIISELVPPGRLGKNSELVIAAITTCKVIAFQWGIVWKDIAANTVKKEITDDGRASKVKIKNAVLDLFPEMIDHHARLKKDQKKKGERSVGIVQDTFDAVAIAVAGAKIHSNLGDKN